MANRELGVATPRMLSMKSVDQQQRQWTLPCKKFHELNPGVVATINLKIESLLLICTEVYFLTEISSIWSSSQNDRCVNCAKRGPCAAQRACVEALEVAMLCVQPLNCSLGRSSTVKAHEPFARTK
jgi:hypothetical protein